MPVKNDCVQERRFGLLNTGIYLIFSGSSDRLMLPGFFLPPSPNEFLWLDMAQPRLSTPIKKKWETEVYISQNCVVLYFIVENKRDEQADMLFSF